MIGPAELTDLLGRLERRLERTGRDAHAAGVETVDTTLLHGSTASAILRYAHDGGHDLIVMGTHGRTGLRRAMLGSVAATVVRKSTCPVLTVRAPVRAESAAGVAVGTGFSP
jgi:nucleotide-binding universal stress UspA family protein